MIGFKNLYLKVALLKGKNVFNKNILKGKGNGVKESLKILPLSNLSLNLDRKKYGKIAP